MKDTFLTFPEPLRKRILLQCAGAGLGITMLLILLVYVRDWYFLFPCAALVIVSLSGAASLYDRCRQKRYVTIEAACTEINRMPFFHLTCSKQLINKIPLPFTSNLCSLSDLCRSIWICDRSFFNFKQSHFHALLCWHIPTWTSSLD